MESDNYTESTPDEIRVAVLGPLGTYTHEAAHQRFGACAVYEERETITDVFDAVSTTVHWGVVPQENTIFGNVIETYDVLRKPNTGFFVTGEVTLRVQHCLLVRQGVQLHEIEKVMSHEQALGQCQDFIATHFPLASLVKTPSTAAAAQALLTNPLNCAAICSRICANLFSGLSILCEGIQSETVNYTRFYIIGKTRDLKVPGTPPAEPHHALIRVSTRVLLSLADVPPPSNILQLLSALQMSVTRIDRRPSTETVPFHDVYFVEVKQERRYEGEDTPWITQADKAVKRVRHLGGNATLVGIW